MSKFIEVGKLVNGSELHPTFPLPYLINELENIAAVVANVEYLQENNESKYYYYNL